MNTMKPYLACTLLTLICLLFTSCSYAALADATADIEINGSRSDEACTHCITSSRAAEQIFNSSVESGGKVTCDTFYRKITKANYQYLEKGGSGVGGSAAFPSSTTTNKIYLGATANLWGTYWAQGKVGDSFKYTGSTSDCGITAYGTYAGVLGLLTDFGKETFNIDLVVFDVTNDVEVYRKNIDHVEVNTIGGPNNINQFKRLYVETRLYSNRLYRIYFEAKVEAISYNAPLAISDFSSQDNLGITLGYIEVKDLRETKIGDLNCNGRVELPEVIELINDWSIGLVSLRDVVTAINNWAAEP